MRRRGVSWAAVAMVAAAGCGTDRLQSLARGGTMGGPSGVSTGGVVGTTATGGAPPAEAGVTRAAGVPLVPSATGVVNDVVSGVVGSWYPFADGIGPNPSPTDNDTADSDCVRRGQFPPSACSNIYFPTVGQPYGPAPATGAMCTSGVAAQVLVDSSGTPDYGDLWGGGIGLDFNNPGGDAGVKGTWDATAFTGIAFDLSGPNVPTESMRVLFPFLGEHGTDAPYFQGQTLGYSKLPSDGHVEIHWSDIGGPLYLTYSAPPVTPPLFDPTQVFSIQFQVFTNASSSTPYAFCVNNLTLLRD